MPAAKSAPSISARSKVNRFEISTADPIDCALSINNPAPTANGRIFLEKGSTNNRRYPMVSDLEQESSR